MIEVNRQRLIQEFMELVQIDSESKQERSMADRIRQTLEPLGVVFEEDDAGTKLGGSTGNLIGRLPGTIDKPAILFTCHMDTVAPGKGVKPIRLEDRITSDGTTVLGSDDKAGVTALIEMVRVIKEQQLDHGPLVLLFTICEEIGLMGSRSLDPSVVEGIAYGFAFDSNGPIGDIVTQAPAQNRIEVVVHGKKAHAGVNPEAGISAIQVAAHAISKMKLGRVDNETTANIGIIGGGVPPATNIVIDRVEVVAEARSSNLNKLEEQTVHMRECFEQTAADFHTKADIQVFQMYSSISFPDDAEIVSIAKRAVTTIGRTPRTFRTGGGSDANVLNGLGLPTLNLAVGYENIHTVEEFIRLDDLYLGVKLIVAVTQCI
ncbi:MAG: peptidase [Bacilli bacterium]|nr:peptidase [Bacilli bacterium]